jgi:hypothetical protein
MTAPTEPMPGASVDDPTAHTAQDPLAVRPEEPRTEPATAAENTADLPDWAQKALRDARAEAARSRTTAKQTAADEARQELTAQIARALGLSEDEEVDPGALTEQIEQAQAAAWRSGVELQVHRVASRLGGNADALLDSLSFIDSLDDLVDADPRSADFATELEAKVQAALEKNQNYRAAGQAPAASTAPRPDRSQGPRGAAPAARPTSLFDAISKAVGPKS